MTKKEPRKPIILFGDNGDFKIQVGSLGFGISVENALESDKYIIEMALNEGLEIFFQRFEKNDMSLTEEEQALVIQTCKGVLAGLILAKRVVNLNYQKLPENKQKNPKEYKKGWD